jgi:hypothetical protein
MKNPRKDKESIKMFVTKEELKQLKNLENVMDIIRDIGARGDIIW